MFSIFHKLKIHISVLFIICVFGFIGELKFVLSCLGIVIFHELGHLFFIMLFGGRLNSISIYPFGGIMNVYINESTSKYKKLIINMGRHRYKPFIHLFV